MKLSITASFVSTDLSRAAPGQPVATERENKGPRWLPVREKTAPSGGKTEPEEPKIIKQGLELELTLHCS